jgi:hypothetical protein
MTPTPERRGSRRQRTKGKLQAHLALEARILQLSSQGMLVRLPFCPEMKSRHAFTLDVGNVTVEVQGIVRNSAPQDEDGELFHVGIEFVDVPRAIEAVLARYVANKLQTS